MIISFILFTLISNISATSKLCIHIFIKYSNNVNLRQLYPNQYYEMFIHQEINYWMSN